MGVFGGKSRLDEGHVGVAVTYVLVLAAVAVLGFPTTASAASCPVLFSNDFVSEAWSAGAGNNVLGFRAPITLRYANLCDGSPIPSASWEWVATEGNSIYGDNGLGISQIGWGKELGNNGACKFYFYLRGDQNYSPPPIVYYDCNPSLGQTQYFKVDASSATTFALYDCGTGGWKGCSLDGLPDFTRNDWISSTIIGVVASEVIYPPVVDMMGSETSPGEYNPIKGKRDSDDWQTRTLTFGGATYPRYHSPVHTDTRLQVYSA